MRIAYAPYENRDNKYIEISEKIIQSLGYEVCNFFDMSFKELAKCDEVILNWYESLSKSRYPFLTELRLVKKIITLQYLRRKQVKIITTFHNRMPHDLKGLINIEAKYLLKRVLQLSDAIIILSKDSIKYLEDYLTGSEIKEKAFYIPHPNYVGVYSDAITQAPEYEVHEKMQILFSGMVRKYKNIELIFEVACRTQNLDIEYTIAGRCPSEEYKQELERKASDLSNIHLKLQFIEDEKIEQLIRKSDIMLLPYDTSSSMNSGTVLLAFSNGRSVICPAISTIKEFDSNLVYSYEYENQQDHIEKLEENVLKAYDDFKNNKDKFEDKGRILFGKVKNDNSVEILSERYKELLGRFL